MAEDRDFDMSYWRLPAAPAPAVKQGVAAIQQALPEITGQTSPLVNRTAAQPVPQPRLGTNIQPAAQTAAPAAAAASPYSFQESRAFGGKTYDNLDPAAVATVKAQLAAQQKAMDPKYWQGNVDLDRMASNLVASGVTDIRQVGKGQAEVGRQSVMKGPDGFYKTVGSGEEMTTARLTPEEEKQVKESNGVYYVPTLGDAIINKTTGERLKSGYGDRTTGNMWSGTYEGKGNTGYGVQFDDKGNPYFYTAPASSSDAKEWLTPLLMAGSFFLPGLTAGLSGSLAGATGLSPAISSALTNGLISGGVNSLAGGDFWKGALTGGLTSFASPYIGQGIKALGIENPIVNNMAQGAASSGVKAIASGRDVGDAILSGGLSGAAGGAANEYAPDNPLLQQGIKLLPSLIQNGSINPMQLAMAAAQGMK